MKNRFRGKFLKSGSASRIASLNARREDAQTRVIGEKLAEEHNYAGSILDPLNIGSKVEVSASESTHPNTDVNTVSIYTN
jgi:hypothetical protein